jgi:3(or 17)beta-hydroxysteroid dehydrogenase
MGQVQDKVAMVTGGASGLGLEVVRLLIAEGARVLFSDVNAEQGEALAQTLGERARFLRHDVTQEDQWTDALRTVQEHFGPLDILVNNAGILLPGSIATGTVADFRRLMQVNAESCFIGTQQGLAAMRERGGSIVNIASVSSWMPIENYTAYSASKAAVAAVTRSAALHCRNSGLPVRVNSVHPDGIYTPMMQASAPGVPEKYILFDPRKNPKGRAFRPQHIAQVVLFLCSDASFAINGSELRADGAILGTGL